MAFLSSLAILQNDIFFTCLFLADRTRIFATMTGIDGNNHFPVGFADIRYMFNQ